MLNVSAPYPHAGSTAYIDDIDCLGNDIVRKVRIIAHKPEDLVLIGIRDRLAPREAASGNRTVPLSSLRETERPEQHQSEHLSQPSGRTRGPRSTGAKAGERRR
ncbi:hypothetical protein GR702_13280 [Novosphingobium sp. FGD1]|uniref:Uncharacterized protein n=1 Tax=Novosphingobium silvae TaxID=2692619 RepID=A0A7X4K757_9SPHN|nr:hypothetical protein [Novosphingobium silvae]MYL98736.1 hypothetical protein [Novosphingobium silvae]